VSARWMASSIYRSREDETMNMDMRKSRVLRIMREGKVAIGVKINLACVRGVEIAAMCDFDCVWLDLEHVPNDYFCIENAVRAAKLYDCDILTRVSKGCYSDMVRPFEADSTGIMVPHLMSLKEAKQIVYYTKFYPVGRRPLDGGNADGKYCMVDMDTYMKQSNEERFVVVQIEDPEPLPELEEICALEGIDMIFFGPGDFSQGIGAPGKMADPRISETRKRIGELARKHGKFAGTVGSCDCIAEYADMGYSFVSVGADVIELSRAYVSMVEKSRRDLKKN